MTSETRPPVKFEKPPVLEVVVSVAFGLSLPLKTVDIGQYWQIIRSEFPNVSDAQPVQSIVEGSGVGIAFSETLQMIELPPLRRVWFSSEDGQRLIQLQEDRFLFNWKLVNSENKYPSFKVIFPEFLKRFEEFRAWLKSTGREDLNVSQLELTYVNLIPLDTDSRVSWNSVLVDHLASRGARFLPEPIGFQWNTAYALPAGEGRLHISAQKVHSQTDVNKMAVRFDLVARGMPSDASAAGQLRWYEMGHEWITRGFADATSPEIQKSIWKRVS